MTNNYPPAKTVRSRPSRGATSRKSFLKRRRILIGVLAPALAFGFIGVAVMRIAGQSQVVRTELQAAAELVPGLRQAIAENKTTDVYTYVMEIQGHTAAAREATEDPLWKLSAVTPVVGPNFRAVTEIAISADDVAVLGVAPLAKVFNNLDWEGLVGSRNGTNVEEIRSAAPSVASAAHAVHVSSEKLNQIDESRLFTEIAEPLDNARKQLQEVSSTLDAAADTSQLAPALLGSDSTRTYLVMVQNNAESRASGGIPGALAILTVENGKLALGAQTSATAIGPMDPVLQTDDQQRSIYTARLGKYMQDVNLTPDFPTAAAFAQAMWQRKFGQKVDGVISIDPVALSYVMRGTGPIEVSSPELQSMTEATGLPREITSDNVVETLLSDTYAKIEQPDLQDSYYAGVAGEIFSAFADGQGDAKKVLAGITQGSDEGRILFWASQPSEQSVIGKYKLSGSIAGSNISPAEFGVYFNDGTGAKMDYYVKRTVQLIKECPRDGYEQTTVRVTSMNTAPADAATSLPPYVTGDGVFGVPPGSVQTNIVAYGPVQAQVETAKLDGQKIEFAPHIHNNRPVGVLAIRLAPGESRSVDFTFGKIVQHTEPNVVVTPTVQDVKDVTLPTVNAACS